LGAPLFALLARRAWLRYLTIGLAVVNLVPCVLQNVQAPILVPKGGRTIFAMNRFEQQTIIRPEMLPVLEAVNRRLGRKAPIGFDGGDDSWDYPFFGEHHERRVVRVLGPQVTPVRMRSMGLKAVVVANLPPPSGVPFTTLAPGYYLVPAS
jgi:hypothetical protein